MRSLGSIIKVRGQLHEDGWDEATESDYTALKIVEELPDESSISLRLLRREQKLARAPIQDLVSNDRNDKRPFHQTW